MNTAPRRLLIVFLVLLLLVFAGGIRLFRVQKQQWQHQIEDQLASIARLKVEQIIQWRQERVADAQVISDNPFFNAAATRWLAEPEPAIGEQLLAWFRSLKQQYRYADILLVDAAGTVRLSLSGRQGPLDSAAREILDQAIRERRPILADLHRPADGPPYQDAITPLAISAGKSAHVLGGLVLRGDAGGFLYPMLQSWPVASETAETLLVRREGDAVLFLNELRHRQETALRLRVSLSETTMLAVKAMNGAQGVLQARDYRGVEVLGLGSPIPDSPWLLVTKIDVDEAMAGWRILSWYIAGLILTAAIALVTGLLLFWQRRAKHIYRAAFEAEARFRAILMSVGDGVIACDREGRVILLNPVAETLTGWSQQAAQGKPIKEVFVIVNEDTRLPVDNPVERVLREGVVVGLANHTSLLTPDGREFPIADSGAPIIDAEGQIAGAVLVFRDQTEERQAEAALRRSNHLLLHAEEMAHMGCWEFDFKTRTVWGSPSARRIYGLDDLVWTIEAAQDIPLAEYRPAMNRALKALIQEDEPYDVEFRIRRPGDGAVVDIRSQAEYNRDEEKVFGIIQDISEQKRTEAAIRESESRYRALFQNNHAVMLLIDPDNGMVVDANPAAERYYGWSREALLAKNISEINTLAPEEIKAEMTRAHAGEKNCFEFRHRLADGRIRDVEVYSGLIEIEGRQRLYSIVHDVTARKQAEEKRAQLHEQLLQAQKLESVGRLAGGVAHDLNNMLSPILGYSDVLLMDLPEGDPRRISVHAIIQAGERARDLVRQLLAFGRKQTLVVETVDLNEVVASFIGLLRRTIREDIAIEMVPAPRLPAVRVDVGQIEQVIMNLVVNAQDAMPEGGRILIETAVAEPDQDDWDSHAGLLPGSAVQLTVSDTGCGMTAEVREQIFAPFFTTKPLGQGTGLGLAMTYGIVKQHGGEIQVTSEPGRGTTFIIQLPSVAAVPEPKDEQTPRTREHATGSETVMVVEDNDMVRQLAVDILSRRGYTVLAAGGGAECLRTLAEHAGPVDLLLTDVIMPEMNGKALYEQAVRLRPGLQVLFMSGYTENVIAFQGVLDQDVAFIHKPFAPGSLAAKVREVLHRTAQG